MWPLKVRHKNPPDSNGSLSSAGTREPKVSGVEYAEESTIQYSSTTYFTADILCVQNCLRMNRETATKHFCSMWVT